MNRLKIVDDTEVDALSRNLSDALKLEAELERSLSNTLRTLLQDDSYGTASNSNFSFDDAMDQLEDEEKPEEGFATSVTEDISRDVKHSIGTRVAFACGSDDSSPSIDEVNNLDNNLNILLKHGGSAVIVGEGEEIGEQEELIDSPDGAVEAGLVPLSREEDSISWSQSGVSIRITADMLSMWKSGATGDTITSVNKVNKEEPVAETVVQQTNCGSASVTNKMDDLDMSAKEETKEEIVPSNKKLLYLEQVNAHERDDRLMIILKTHRYVLRSPEGGMASVSGLDCSSVISVSSFLKLSFDHFDSHAVSMLIYEKSHQSEKEVDEAEKLEGSKAIRMSWKEKTGAGVLLHSAIEQKLNNMAVKELECEVKSACLSTSANVNVPPSIEKEFGHFLNFLIDATGSTGILHGYSLYRTEWGVFDEDCLLAGTIDAVFRKRIDGMFTDDYIILDWKRVANLEKSEFKPFGHHNYLECNKLPNTQFCHYSVQLSAYKKILLNKYGASNVELYLVQLHPENENYVLKPIVDESDQLNSQVDALIEASIEIRKHIMQPCKCGELSVINKPRNGRHYYSCRANTCDFHSWTPILKCYCKKEASYKYIQGSGPPGSPNDSSSSSSESSNSEDLSALAAPMCKCDIPALRRSSKSAANYGRYYWACSKQSPWREKGIAGDLTHCGWFQWCNPSNSSASTEPSSPRKGCAIYSCESAAEDKCNFKVFDYQIPDWKFLARGEY